MADKKIGFGWDGKMYLVDSRAGEIDPPAIVVLSSDRAIQVLSWLETDPPQIKHAMRLNVNATASPDALAKLLGIDYGDQNVFVAEVVPTPMCPRCGADTGTSEGQHGRCPNCGYEL